VSSAHLSRSKTGPSYVVLALGSVAAIYLARDVLLPFALATLLSFLLAPVVKRLEQRHIGRVPAVSLTVLGAFLAIGLLSYVMLNQVYDLAYRLPEYELNIAQKIRSLEGSSDGVVGRVSKAIDDVRSKLAERATGQPPPTAERHPTTEPQVAPRGDRPANVLEEVKVLAASEPIPVQVIEHFSIFGLSQRVLGPLVEPLGTAGLVVVFTIFMLIKREDLRNRFISLVGAQRICETTQAMDAAAQRVARYLRTQLIVNAIFGGIVAVGLLLIGVPNAIFWGVMAMFLRFVPFVGSSAAGLVPLAITMAMFDGWTRPILLVVLYLGTEVAVANALEPLLVSASTGVSALGILVSTVVWMWLWGPVGLILATPLTVCLAVVVGYVPGMSFLNALLHDDQVLPAHAQFYQRLLADDVDEAWDVAEDYAKRHSLEAFYDDVLVPALGLAEADQHQGMLDEATHSRIRDSVRELIDELSSRAKAAAIEPDAEPRSDEPSRTPVVCFPAADEADETVGLVLAQLLAARGIKTHVLSPTALASEMIEAAEAYGADVVCVSALPPQAGAHTRYLCKRLSLAAPQRKVVIGLWQPSAVGSKTLERLNATGIEACVTTLAAATDEIERLERSASLLRSGMKTPTGAGGPS